MSNPYDPNGPGAPPPPPSSGWGAPPGAPPPQSPFGAPPGGAWNAPQAPYAAPPNASGGSGSKWVIGCLVVLLVIVACCGGTIAFGFFALKKAAAEVVQEQATAMNTGNIAEVCRHNSPALQINTPCTQYVQWLNAYAPWFAGSTIHVDDVDLASDPQYGLRYTIRVTGTGARGTGHLTFAVVSIGGKSFIQAIVPQQ